MNGMNATSKQLAEARWRMFKCNANEPVRREFLRLILERDHLERALWLTKDEYLLLRNNCRCETRQEANPKER